MVQHVGIGYNLKFTVVTSSMNHSKKSCPTFQGVSVFGAYRSLYFDEFLCSYSTGRQYYHTESIKCYSREMARHPNDIRLCSKLMILVPSCVLPQFPAILVVLIISQCQNYKHRAAKLLGADKQCNFLQPIVECLVHSQKFLCTRHTFST